MKTKPKIITERYDIEYRLEKNSLGKKIEIWYIRDLTWKKHGKIIAKFWQKGPANLALEYLNHKKKIRKKKYL